MLNTDITASDLPHTPVRRADQAQRSLSNTGDHLYPMCHAPAFRLGMPHMAHMGVSCGWLLREACHIQWGAIAAQMGVHPTEFRDRSGARVVPSVVACTLNGDASQFREDDLCELFLTETPDAENGWRGQVELRNVAGSTLRAEIITSFSRRSGQSNVQLEDADLEEQFRSTEDGEHARRTTVITKLGEASRVLAAGDTDPPHHVIEIDRHAHVNGVGLVYFAAIHDMIERTEAKAMPDLVGEWPLRDRRAHFFGNLDVEDSLEISARPSVQALGPSGSVLVRSHARRASDGEIVATAESFYGR